MPQKSLASSFEKSADGRKSQKERVTINACSNATGTIKLPLQMIGKAKNPRCFKNIARDNLPLLYENQKNSWMNTEIFLTWFHKTFVPIVKKKLQELDVEPRAVLILDNCSAHPSEDQLVSADGKIMAKFLPPNVTSLIQPMDQGVLESLKRRYRRKILEELVLQDADGVSILDYLKSINMLRVTTVIAACWDEIPEKTLRLSWRKILPEGPAPLPPTTDAEEPTQLSVEAFASMFQEIGHSLTDDEVGDWLVSDANDMGYKHLSDDEIVSSMIQEQEATPDSESDDATSETSSVSHSSAVKMFDGCLQWLQEQEESSLYNIQVIKELRELAARKRMSTIKQKKISDFFTPCMHL